MSTKKLKWVICFLIIMGNFLAMMDSSSVNLALYPIANDLEITLGQVQWIVIAYMLVLTVFLPLFGKLGDIFSKNKVYGYGFLIFALGALLNSLSINFYMLITFRCIEAIGASIMMANGPGTIASLFKGAQRGKALGLNGCLVAAGGLIGPAIGGVLINSFGWRTIFLPSVPVAIIAAFASFKLLPDFTPKRTIFKFDYKGFIYFSIALFALLLAISEGHQWGWKSIQIISLGTITLIFGALFYLRDRKINYPLINLNMFKIKTFSFGNIAVMLAYMCMFTNAILLPFFLQEIIKYNAFVAGLLILPYSVASSAIAPFAGSYSGKHGSHILTKIGPIIYIIALLLFTTFNIKTSMWQIIFASFLMGVGNGLFQSPSNNAIITSVPKEELGVASGILSLSRNLGNILGVAITFTLFDHFKTTLLSDGLLYQNAFIKAFHWTMYFGIGFGLICLICASIAYKQQRKF